MKKRKDGKEKYQVWAIHWEDHYSNNHGWEPLGSDTEIRKYVCLTVGFIVQEDEDHIVLADTLSPTRASTNHMVVLKSCIKKRERLNFHAVL